MEAMTSIATHRTPISILQEVCVKKGITPVYELVSSEGPIHEPNYVFLCSAGPFSATSKGASKKKAKHQASYLVLLKMLASSAMSDSEKMALRDLHHSAASLLGSDFLDALEMDDPEFAVYRMHREEESNFVGQLQELCQKNMWPPPTYEFVTVSRLIPAMHEYHCRVSLWKWTCEGFGTSKKQAKRHAAGALLERIVARNLTIPPEALESMEEENLSLLSKEEKACAQEPKGITENETRLSAKALRWLCDAKGSKIQFPCFDTSEAPGDSCGKLEELIEKVKISAVYTYIHNTDSGKVYCLVQLSTLPLHVIKGLPSNNLNEARQSAARRCILFLKTMASATPEMNYEVWFAQQTIM
ncbi:Interferon inducible double stranded [Fasciola hepatica]|uniref:Interferon inducible double stranded n=1 Tax=Fasciola hepatica TaxID=6192 RepID=A0A4E0R1Q8_FASHE|nr:Interferon inducible double stranded [Fasciola hepatica]